jgi:hypothetical protein
LRRARLDVRHHHCWRTSLAAKKNSAKATKTVSLAERLRALGTKGVLVQMAERGQIIELRCEMPKCYCPNGRSYFEPRSQPPPTWSPSADHYPKLKADGGTLVPWNVRLSHVLCNQADSVSRIRIRQMLEKGMSLEEIATALNEKETRWPHGSAWWSAALVREAFVS